MIAIRTYRPSLHLLTALFFSISTALFGQTKTEVEYKVKKELVPAQAVDFIEDCNFSKKVKWYIEVSEQGKSFEAKTKHRKTLYSIEFDSTGFIEDVEWIIGFNDLPELLQKQLYAELEKEFVNYRIVKIQVQWTGDPDSLKTLIKSGSSEEKFTTNYEIELSGTFSETQGYFEVLTNDRGEILKISKIVHPSSDNIIF